MLGFTKQEQGIVLFLIFSLIVGASVKFYFRFFSEESAFEINQDFVDAFSKKADELNAKENKPGLSLESNGVHFDSSNPAKTPVAETEGRQGLKTSLTEEFVIDINSASEKELQLIPRIGPVLAQRIVQYRHEKGNFKQLEDLQQVKGIGNATFNKIVPYVKVEGIDTN